MASFCPDTLALTEASEDNTDTEEIQASMAGTNSHRSQVKPVHHSLHEEVTDEDRLRNVYFQQQTEKCPLQEQDKVQGQGSPFQETSYGGQNAGGHREHITDLDESAYQRQQQNTGLHGACSSHQRQNEEGQGRKHSGQGQGQNHRPRQQNAEHEDAHCQEESKDKASCPTTQSEKADENSEVQGDTSLSGPQQFPKTSSCQMSNMTDSAQDFSGHQHQLPTKSPCLASDMTDSEDVPSERYESAPNRPILEQIRPESREKKQSREEERGGRGRDTGVL